MSYSSGRIPPQALLVGGIGLIAIVALALLNPSSLGFGAAGTTFGGIALNLDHIYLSDSTGGLTGASIWRSTIVYTGTQGNELIGTIYDTDSKSLQTSDGKTSKEQIKVSSGVTKLSCNYPISLTQQGSLVYEKITPLPVTLQIGSNTVSAQCAAALAYNYKTSISYTSGVGPDVNGIFEQCGDSYVKTCQAQGNGAYAFISKKNQLFGTIYTGDSVKYVCARIERSTEKAGLSLYTPSTPIPDVNIKYVFSNLGTGKTESLSLTGSNTTITSSDNLVRVTLAGGAVAFGSPYCPEQSEWYLLTRDGTTNTAIIPRASVPTPLGATGNEIASGQDYELLSTKVKNYNTALDNLWSGTYNFLDSGNAKYDEFKTATVANSQVVIDRIGRPMLYPMASVDMSVDFASIHEPIATPSKIQAIPTTLTLSENGQKQKVDIYVTNGGDSGALTASVSCTPSGLNTEGGIGLTVGTGQTQGYSFYHWGSKGSYACTAKACNSPVPPTVQTCIQTTYSVNVKAQCAPGSSPNPNYGLVYYDNGSCAWVCQKTQSSCPTGYHLSGVCSCDPDQNQTCPLLLKSCQYCTAGVVYVKDGFSIDSNGNCQQSNLCTKDSIYTCLDKSNITLATCTNGQLINTGKSPNDCSGVACTFPYVPSTSTTTSQNPLSQIPIVNIFFPQTTTTTETCVLDPFSTLVVCGGGFVLLAVVGGVSYLGFSKKGGRRK